MRVRAHSSVGLRRIACVVLFLAAGCEPAVPSIDVGAAIDGGADAPTDDAGARDMDAGEAPDADRTVDAASPLDAMPDAMPDATPDAPEPLDAAADGGACPTAAVGSLWGTHAGVDLTTLVLAEHFSEICTGQRWTAGFAGSPSDPIVARLAIDHIVLPPTSPPPTVIFGVGMPYGTGEPVNVTFSRLDETTGVAGDFTSRDGTFGGHFDLPSCPLRMCL